MLLPDASDLARVADVYATGRSAPLQGSIQLRLASLWQREAADKLTHRQHCESLLNSAVELRAEKRQLQAQANTLMNDKLALRQAQVKEQHRGAAVTRRLQEELKLQKRHLDDTKRNLKEVDSIWAMEDSPQEVIKEAEAEIRLFREQHEELTEAQAASEQLAKRLALRVPELQNQVTQLRISAKANAHKPLGASPRHRVTKHDLEKLEKEIAVLESRAAIIVDEAGEEGRRLFDHLDVELPRLRAAHGERRRMQTRLYQAQWEHDKLEKDYERIIKGLEDQEVKSSENTAYMKPILQMARREGEEMVAKMKKNDEAIAEMRHERSETEMFISHLTTTLRRLEADRTKLAGKVRSAVPSSPPSSKAAAMDPRAKAESLAWQRQDHDRLVQETRAALQRDESEAEAAHIDFELMQRRLPEAEARNAELRAEVAAMAPYLRTRLGTQAALGM